MIGYNKYEISDADKKHSQDCKTCIRKKQVKMKSTGKLVDVSANAIVHTVICTPIQLSTFVEKNYVLTLNAARLRYTNVLLLSHRNEIVDHCHDNFPGLNEAPIIGLNGFIPTMYQNLRS